MTDDIGLAEDLHRAGEELDLERDGISELYDTLERTDDDHTEYLSEDLHRTGEEMSLKREMIADVYNWLNGTDAEEVAKENTEEYLKEVDEAYDRLHEMSSVEGYSSGLAWDAAGEAFSNLEE